MEMRGTMMEIYIQFYYYLNLREKKTKVPAVRSKASSRLI